MRLNNRGMELPISIVIVFLVSVAVAMLVINFAGQIISQGQGYIKEFSLDCTKDSADFFVEASRVDDFTLIRLSELCYRTHFGNFSGDKLCYIIHGINGVNVNPSAISSSLATTFPSMENALPQIGDLTGAKTVYIRFISSKQALEIST